MLNPVFVRAFERILARNGSDALLRSVLTTRVHVAYDVEVTGDFGEVVGTRTIATMWATDAPAQGDALALGTLANAVFTPAETFVIDSPPFANNGVSLKVVLRRVS